MWSILYFFIILAKNDENDESYLKDKEKGEPVQTEARVRIWNVS